MPRNSRHLGSFVGYRPRRWRRGRLSRERKRKAGQTPYKVSEFVLLYLLALVLFSVAVALAPLVAFALYLPVGIYLSRYIGLRVSWWDQSDNLENVSSAKLRLVATWPLSVPMFLAQMAIAKFL